MKFNCSIMHCVYTAKFWPNYKKFMYTAPKIQDSRGDQCLTVGEGRLDWTRTRFELVSPPWWTDLPPPFPGTYLFPWYQEYKGFPHLLPRPPPTSKCVYCFSDQALFGVKLFSIAFSIEFKLKWVTYHSVIGRRGTHLDANNIHPARGRRFEACPRLNESTTFTSTFTGRTNNIWKRLTCKSAIIVYLITCMRCSAQ